MSQYSSADPTKKVEVGQVWRLRGDASEYLITSVRNRCAYHHHPGSGERPFGDVSEDGLPRWYCPGWLVKTMDEKELADLEDQKRREAHAEKWL